MHKKSIFQYAYKYEMSFDQKSIPRSPFFRRGKNLGGYSINHFRVKGSLKFTSVLHESISIVVLLMEVVDEIWVVGIGHPMVRVLPQHSMSGHCVRHFLGDWWRLGWRENVVLSAEVGEWGRRGCVGK